ncbi:MAG: hypothetical protein RL518_2346 [Pseudomonadota bacterium]|jgi:tetratricopeptide (TPR) repeat protein
MPKLLKHIGLSVLALIVWGTWTLPAWGEGQPVAKVYLAEGSVEVRRHSATAWSPLATGDPLNEGDTVRTGGDGQAAFKFVDGALVRIGRLSALTFNSVGDATRPEMTQHKGRAFFFSRGSRTEPSIKTPYATAAIYGTELIVDVSDDQTRFDVLHGSIKASNSKGEESGTAGESITARKGLSLTKTILVKPADAVQWMIRFPFIVTTHDLVPAPDSTCSSRCVEQLTQAITHAGNGSTLYAQLQGLPREVQSLPRTQILTAIALWQVGDTSAAKSILSRLGTSLSDRDNALRLLLLGFSALQANDLHAAQAHLEQAESKLPGLANAALLHSYIAQGSGALDDAIDITTTARERFPTEPIFLDRSSELLLSADRYEEATNLIEQRSARFGSGSMSTTLAGFAALANKEYERAQDLFESATRQDPSQSLPYLGSSLISAHNRDYSTAKDKLSQAVQLDPSVSVYRSYLGKLFFEDEQSPRALQEFDAAVAMDPNDPTPYLYRSYAKVAENDPIGGLRDVEASIARNEGRAVYRSSLLLDRDLGVRSAGLARTFNELGFSEAARVEAIKSITDDYTNFSAHRLLGDSYQSIMDTEANLSEKRIADLLAPLSFNLFNSVGEFPTLGDYNALFDKKETRRAIESTWNSNHDQISGSLLAVGRGDEYGYLLNYRPYYANGSRNGSYFGDNLFRGALQYEPNPEDRFIIDTTFKLRELNGSESGDYSEDAHLGSARLGYHHRFATNLKFLMQGEYARDSERTSEYTGRLVGVDVPGEPNEFDTEAYLNESAKQRVARSSLSNQLIYTSHYLDSVSGVDGMYVDSSRREDSPVDGMEYFPPPQSLISSSAGNLTSGEVYEYLSLKAPRYATLTLGVSANHLERDLTEVPPFLDGTDTINKVDPKIGLVLTPSSWITGRFAYFETTNKTVLEDLSSLEPTLVGGINQRFNDLSGAQSRNLGFGLDLKDPNFMYVGAQYTRRHIIDSFGEVQNILSYDGESTVQLPSRSYGLQDSHADSDILRGYVYTVLTDTSVLTADSLYERFSETDDALLNNTDIDAAISTQRYRFGYRYFIGKHFSVSTQATYRDQQLLHTDDPNGFWLFDLGTSYRFSEQHGRIFARIDNLLDRDFTYDQSRGIEPEVLQGRSFVVGITYNFF